MLKLTHSVVSSCSRFSVVGTALLFASHVNADGAKMQEFYCKEAPIARPMIYETVMQACGNGQASVKKNICAVPSLCAYIGGDTLKQVNEISQKFLSKKFDELTNEEKSALLNKVMPPTAWLTSSLTCQKTAAGAICPEPEKCKGDLYYNTQVADLDLSTFNRLRDKAELEKSKPGSVRAVPMGETNSAGNLEQSK